ncbi:MAG TPA: hypothetical protein VHO06_25940 [Polyangia bacterium]|nr:hypothetical protein [Polyangia bacterium]
MTRAAGPRPFDEPVEVVIARRRRREGLIRTLFVVGALAIISVLVPVALSISAGLDQSAAAAVTGDAD